MNLIWKLVIVLSYNLVPQRPTLVSSFDNLQCKRDINLILCPKWLSPWWDNKIIILQNVRWKLDLTNLKSSTIRKKVNTRKDLRLDCDFSNEAHLTAVAANRLNETNITNTCCRCYKLFWSCNSLPELFTTLKLHLRSGHIAANRIVEKAANTMAPHCMQIPMPLE